MCSGDVGPGLSAELNPVAEGAVHPPTPKRTGRVDYTFRLVEALSMVTGNLG